jgi:hypothetical protein
VSGAPRGSGHWPKLVTPLTEEDMKPYFVTYAENPESACTTTRKSCNDCPTWVVRLVPGFPPRQPGFEPESGHVGFVVNKVALRQVSSEFFGLTCQFAFCWLLDIHHLRLIQLPQYQVDSVSPLDRRKNFFFFNGSTALVGPHLFSLS